MRPAAELRARIASGKPTLGVIAIEHVWVGLVEICMKAGLDYLIVDGEHASPTGQTLVDVFAFGRIAGFPVLYRPPKRAFIQKMILDGRKRDKLHLAPADVSGVRALIKALKRGQAVGMLPDQAPKEGEGAWVKFFGRYAYTMTLAARLSETGATTLMA